MKKIAIIPARGGSKRIPRKNIKHFLGKPIIAYSIQAANESNLFDEVMVSTDDREIADVAIQYGAKVPFFRSEKNADDFSTIPDVMREVLNSYLNLGIEYEYACCIYPTGALVTSKRLEQALTILEDERYYTSIPIVRFGYPPQRAFVMDDNGYTRFHDESSFKKRSQDLEPLYYDAGLFAFFNTREFFKTGKIIGEKTAGILISELEAQDIDNMDDWELAEFKYKFLKEKGLKVHSGI